MTEQWKKSVSVGLLHFSSARYCASFVIDFIIGKLQSSDCMSKK